MRALLENGRRSAPFFMTLAGLAAFVLATAPLQAQERWQLRGFAAWGSAGSGWELIEDANSIEVAVDQLSGWGLAVDYRFSTRFALELGYLDSNVDSEARLSLSGVQVADRFDVGFSPFTLGLGINLLPAPKLDLVLSPRLAWIDYGNPYLNLPEIESVGELTLDDEVSWSLGLRLDLPLGSWLISGGVEFFDAAARVTNPDVEQDIRIAIDPWLLTVGVGYRF